MLPVLLVIQGMIRQPVIFQAHDKRPTAIAPNPAQETDILFYPKGYTWVRLGCVNHEIVSVGERKLPIPVHIPEEIVPLGHQALLSAYVRNTKLGFSLYFSSASEVDIRKWTNKFPSNPPFPQGYYQAGSLQIHNRVIGSTWRASVSVKGPFDYANILLIPITYSPTEAESSGDTPFGKDIRNYTRAWASAGSPIKHQYKFIEMSVYCNFAQSK